MQSFHSLQVWQKSHRLVVIVYRLTGKYPARELYGLTSQIRRACVSIPANIAEGCGRQSDADFARMLQIAMGSASELEYLLLLSRDLELLRPQDYQLVTEGVVEVKRMLTALIRKLRADS